MPVELISSICDAFSRRQMDCAVVAKTNETLQQMYDRHIVEWMSETTEYCHRGLTSLGRYQRETCTLVIPFDYGMSQEEEQHSCMRQFKCFSKNNPWNITNDQVPLYASVYDFSKASKQELALRPLLSECRRIV